MVVETGSSRGRGEKLPPHDVDAEEAVIASILVDPDAIYKVAPRLKGEDFFREKNAWVYQACRALWDRSESINQVTVSHELARAGKLEDVGGVSYLSRLVTELPTSIGVEHYAGIVQRDAIYRRLIAAVRSGDALRDFVHIRELLQGYLENAESGTGAIAAQTRAVTTGFMDLDTLLGGLKRGDLVIVAARPSLGNNSLVLNYARNAAAKQRSEE